MTTTKEEKSRLRPGFLIYMRLSNLKPKVKKIYIDMDGVIADFEKHAADIIRKEFPNDPVAEGAIKAGFSGMTYEQRSKMWEAVEKYQKEGGKLWGELDVITGAHKLIERARMLTPNVEILSATGPSKYGAVRQKKNWLKEHFGKIKANFVPKAELKGKFGNNDSLLIDDTKKAVDAFEKNGGHVIHHESIVLTLKRLELEYR